MSRHSSWEETIGKLSFRLSKWKLKALSIGGRLTLIKYVLSPLPLYHMSIFKYPMVVLKILKSIRRNFFNGVANSDRKLSLIGWKNILASKKNGGLGALDISIRLPARCSPWLNILREFRRLSQKDRWLSDLPLKHLYPRVFRLELEEHVTVASKLRDMSLMSSFRRAPRGGIEEDQFRLLRASVAHILLPRINDRWVWNLESSGEFSVKSACSFIDDSLLPKVDAPTRWVKVVPIEINIFGWRVCLDKLPTRLNLSLRGVDILSILCPLCSIAVESSSHLLFSCQLARYLMLKVAHWWELEIHNFNSYGDWLIWLKNIRLPLKLKKILEGSCYVMWVKSVLPVLSWLVSARCLVFRPQINKKLRPIRRHTYTKKDMKWKRTWQNPICTKLDSMTFYLTSHPALT
ncbi:RNA-directed DNA polymerase, eukaryota [Tanacetum coccineum]|uniref:RNA-directed DNA polymerase, eukaryota n=1 Tax=Tanacetum coccineum TaxID=301880 RepID=A0ABQ5I6B4_9ASTR